MNRKQRQRLNGLFGSLMVMALLSACVDIVEKDISEKAPDLISPADSVVEYGTLTFWWTEIEGASHYRLQIVSPGFSSPQRLYLDTLVSSAKFDFTPDIGVYEWRAQGVNSAYTSAFSEPKKLEIIEGDNLGRVKLVLKSPANNYITNTNGILFSWQPITIADAYRFQIFSTSAVMVDDTTTGDYYEYTFPDGDTGYQWQVTAFNDHSKSISDKISLTIDKTAPEEPDLMVPKADSAVDFTSPVKFTWIRKSTDIITDSFNIVQDDGDPVAGFSPVKVSTPSVEISNTGTLFKKDNSYQWEVVSIDKAGNKSTSSSRSFTVQKE
jgi:hypothetical protein